MLNLFKLFFTDPHMLDGWAFQCATAHGVVIMFMTYYVSFHVHSGVVWFSTTSPTQLSSRAYYWRQRAEKDTGSETTNPHILAERIINRGGPITHNDINTVLENQGLSITEKELEELKAIKPVTYSLSDLQEIKKQFPKDSKGWCIYQFTNTLTNESYYGSSSNFGLRLVHYLKSHTASNLRRILLNIQQTGIHNFTLNVFPIPIHLQEGRLLWALEQYYILLCNPAYNELKVVNITPGGMRLSEHNSRINSVPLYVSKDGQLIYIFDSLNGITNNAITGLAASTNTILNCLNTGTLFLDVFYLSRTPPSLLVPLDRPLISV